MLLLDEPTRGIDVGAKYEIYQLIIDLAAKGKTVIMVSSEMPELLGVCDRILGDVGRQAGGRSGCGAHYAGRNHDACRKICLIWNGGTTNVCMQSMKHKGRLAANWAEFRGKSGADKRRVVTDLLFNNAMYIIIAIAVVYIAIRVPAFLSVSSIVNIISLTAAKLPIALGIGGAIVLTGTDISAGRVVGLTACISAVAAANDRTTPTKFSRT